MKTGPARRRIRRWSSSSQHHVTADVAAPPVTEIRSFGVSRKRSWVVSQGSRVKPVKYREGIGRLRDRRINRIEIDGDQGSNSGTVSLWSERAWHLTVGGTIDVNAPNNYDPRQTRKPSGPESHNELPAFFEEALDQVHAERRYRVFADLERIAGSVPRAIWRSNSRAEEIRLSGAQRLSRHEPEPLRSSRRCNRRPARMGSGAGGARSISGTNHPLVELELSSADLHGEEAALDLHLRLRLQQGVDRRPIGQAAPLLPDLCRTSSTTPR